MMLYPTRRFYPSNQESGTMVAISSTLREDLYVVYAGTNPDTNLPVIHAYLNPLVKWIWLGGAVVVLGTILALIAESTGGHGDVRRRRPGASAPVPGGAQPAQVSYSARSQLPDAVMTNRRRLALHLRRVRGHRLGAGSAARGRAENRPRQSPWARS